MLPYLTADLPGIGGVLRTTDEDFRVDEVPAYAPSGTGDHVFAQIEKRGLTTPHAVKAIARALGVRERDIGVAGMKDRYAVTTQWISLPPPVTVEAVRALVVDGVTVLEAIRHGHKLRTGHVKANRFRLRVRGVDADAVERARAILARLAEAPGAPNFYGEQRFGRDGDNAAKGRALLAERGGRSARSGGTAAETGGMAGMGGMGGTVGTGGTEEAERRTGAWTPASAGVTGAMGDGGDEAGEGGAEDHVVGSNESAGAGGAGAGGAGAGAGERREGQKRARRAKGRTGREAGTRDERMDRLMVSALQSELFNAWLSARLADGLYRDAIAGDVMHKVGGGMFECSDAAIDGPRVRSGEVIPTGPMFGGSMRRPLEGSVAATREQAILDAAGLTLGQFAAARALAEGTRRDAAIAVTDVTIEIAHVSPTRGGAVRDAPERQMDPGLRRGDERVDGSRTWADGPTGSGSGSDSGSASAAADSASAAASASASGLAIDIAFTLPGGAYATVVMRELMKLPGA